MNIRTRMKRAAKTLLRYTLLPAWYELYRRGPVEKGLVILADSNGEGLPESMTLMAKELKRRGCRVKVMCRDLDRCGAVKGLRFMTDFMRLYARAEAVFICNYFVPVTACRKRPETSVVQLWHGCGCLKKFGFDSSEDNSSVIDRDQAKNFDIICVSAPACVPAFTSAFRAAPGAVRPLGVSRTDVFHRPGYREMCRRELSRKYPEFSGKRIVLWAPTFRGNPSEPESAGEEEIAMLRERLGPDWAVIIRMHPRLQSPLTNCDLDTGIIAAAADMLVTDYSSVVFDFVLTGRPIVLFTPDREKYERERDFYMSFEELPGERAVSGEELYEAVIRSFGREPDERYMKFKEKYMSACDGGATRRIADAALGYSGDDEDSCKG